jgi:predicted N-acetyltransferase YhbS
VDEPSLVRLGLDDAAAAVGVSETVGWRHTVDDWTTALEAGVVFGHRRRDGTLLSTAGLFPYGPTLASIGFVVVRPDEQGHGLAAALMGRCLTFLPPPAPPAMLVATSLGFPLYQRLGFRTVGSVFKLTIEAQALAGARRPAIAGTIEPLARGDVETIQRLDTEALGADRRRMLRARLAQAGGGLVVRSDAGTVTGYAMRTRQGDVAVIGPVITAGAAAAAALIGRLAEDHDGPVRIDVPAAQRALLEVLDAWGFERADEAPLMVRGAAALPGRRDRLFALAARAFG